MPRQPSHRRSVSRRRSRERGSAVPPAAPVPAADSPAGPLSLRHPAAIAALAAVAACVVVSVTFRIIDGDFWQHLIVGKAIWAARSVPHTQVWAWPAYGTPDVLPSWLFRAVLWPVWETGGVTGLFVWRWATTLAAFAAAFVAARRLGARGLTPLVVLAVAALVYRQRSQVRPETLAAVLLALSVWLLETRRQGGRDRSAWLVAVAWVWANAHVSYFMGFVLLAVHLLDAHLGTRGGRRLAPPPGPLWRVALACAAVSFLNPFGWRALWQPFDYLLHVRDTTLFRGIGELRPVGWEGNETNGLFLLLVGWPLLLLARARRRGFDLAETLTCLFFTAYTLPSQRFVSVYALAAAPYAARDLDDWVGSRRWPRWTAAPWARAALTAAAMLCLSFPEWLRPDSPMRPGVGVDLTRYPVAASDFMAAHQIRGRGFNQDRTGGYLLWRFWPDRGRLPFMDIHQGIGLADRDLYAAVFTDARSWAALDGRHRFDWVLLDRRQYGQDRLYDHLDGERDWALVFADDAAVLYLRRDGPLASRAESLAYRVVPAGRERVAAMVAAWGSDAVLRARARAELERQARSSRFHVEATSLLATLAMLEGRFADARGLLERVRRADPQRSGLHDQLGTLALWEGDASRATLELQRERKRAGPRPGLELKLGMARQLAGDLDGARRHYLAELRLDPTSAAARELLDSLAAAARPRVPGPGRD